MRRRAGDRGRRSSPARAGVPMPDLADLALGRGREAPVLSGSPLAGVGEAVAGEAVPGIEDDQGGRRRRSAGALARRAPARRAPARRRRADRARPGPGAPRRVAGPGPAAVAAPASGRPAGRIWAPTARPRSSARTETGPGRAPWYQPSRRKPSPDSSRSGACELLVTTPRSPAELDAVEGGRLAELRPQSRAARRTPRLAAPPAPDRRWRGPARPAARARDPAAEPRPAPAPPTRRAPRRRPGSRAGCAPALRRAGAAACRR